MAAVDPNLKFRYIVVEGEMVEIPENEVHDETSVIDLQTPKYALDGWQLPIDVCKTMMRLSFLIHHLPLLVLLPVCLLSLQLQRTPEKSHCQRQQVPA